MKRVALFGGSFNPPHDGHFQAIKHIHESLNVDEIWMMFSLNHQKDPGKYAPLHHRIEMGRIMQSAYPDTPVVLSDIEEELGTHITHEVLIKLKDRFPDHQFIWIMGSDNLASFHTWEKSDDIIENFPIVVVDRPPYQEGATSSPTALTYPHLKVDDPKTLMDEGKGWCVIKGQPLEMSSSHLLEQLKHGQTKFSGAFQKVADYIHAENLYGISPAPREAAPAPLLN